MKQIWKCHIRDYLAKQVKNDIIYHLDPPLNNNYRRQWQMWNLIFRAQVINPIQIIPDQIYNFNSLVIRKQIVSHE